MADLDLNRIAIRVLRDGRPQSLFISQLEYLDDSEIMDLTWRGQLIETLAATWHWDRLPGARRWINLAPSPPD